MFVYLTDPLEGALKGLQTLDVATEVQKCVDYLKRTNRRRGPARGDARRDRTLLRPFARRAGRELTEGERAVVVARLDTHGADRLAEVVLDLCATELAAWLADPSAT